MPKRQAATAAGEKAKKAKTGDNYEIEKFKLSWSMVGAGSTAGVGDIMVLDGDLPGCSKAAGFDIDYTLIETKSGRKFATGAKDWKWLYSCVPEELKKLHDDGYRVIFYTNQAGIEKNKTNPKDIIKKINDMVEQLDIPVFAFVCPGMNHYRKPSTLMWDHFVKDCNKDVKLVKKYCIYVGDAAGRAKNWEAGKPKDFSCGDRMFAANIGIDFKTPEEFFKKEDKAPFKWGSINPVNYLKNAKTDDAEEIEYHSKKQEMILMVGPPASGKSTFTKRHLIKHGYVSVNRDTLRTPAKCLKVAQQSLDDGNSVVVDNTNPATQTRAEYIRMAKNADVACRCFILETPMELAHHLNMVRQNQTNGEVRRIPDVAYNMYKSRYEEPQLTEGFSEIKTIKFSPEFDSARDEELFKLWS